MTVHSRKSPVQPSSRAISQKASAKGKTSSLKGRTRAAVGGAVAKNKRTTRRLSGGSVRR